MAEQLSFEEYSHFFKVKLDFFDGPVDLLLHLVKQNELPIEKVALAEVANQYLECVEAMRLIDLDIAGEYLVIAATLLSIKAAVLLNEPVELVPDEDGNLIDPHDELLRRLREAEIYREGASFLSKRGCLGLEVFAPPARLADFPTPEPELREHDPLLLGQAFRKLLERVDKNSACYQIEFEPVSIVERMMSIIDTLKQARQAVPFTQLIPKITRSAILSSFIALLELCKRQVIRVVQDESFSEIKVALADEEAAAAEMTSEFDAEEERQPVTVNA